MMNTSIDAKQQYEGTTLRETNAADVEKLTAESFTYEEITAMLWLRQWYQAGGSDRVALLRHWEFLKHLVLTNKLAS